LAAVVCVGALLAVAVPALAGIGPNPANDPALVNKRIEGFRYDPARRCSGKHGVPDGSKAMAAWLDRHTGGVLWGYYRCEKLSSDSFSLHSEARAIDWAMDAKDKSQKRQAMALIVDRFLATDRKGNAAALARRMGIQGIIFDCRAWWAGQERLGDYSYCFKRNGKRRKNLDPTQAHMDHIHIELNWAGARESTSFWRSPLARK
jgi:hypothetical protein